MARPAARTRQSGAATLTFLGAAGEVTGSCYLVETGEPKFLIDCGMFQGGRQAGQRNRRFGFDPRDIAFVLLSHAHIDHSGLLPRLVVQDPTPVESADVLLVESTYGDRNHKSLVQTLDEFAYALNDTLSSRKGNVVIPSFSVGRTQDILYYIGQLRREERVPPMNVYVDSPMALATTRITLKHAKLPDLGGVHFTESVEESMRIFGELYPVRAKVFTIGGLSSHADRTALLGWLGCFKRPPRQTWVVHGEPFAARALRDEIRRKGWSAQVPSPGETANIGSRYLTRQV